uniref:Uncharacterized protein n=1 Tax=Vespula pensylvanica TaxID=30213 RepID=A0A834KS44_VESPE|nr:hypothetical protein H0235_012900 [Vespula pensylvanica]
MPTVLSTSKMGTSSKHIAVAECSRYSGSERLEVALRKGRTLDTFPGAVSKTRKTMGMRISSVQEGEEDKTKTGRKSGGERTMETEKNENQERSSLAGLLPTLKILNFLS